MSLSYLSMDESAQYYACGFSCDNALLLHLNNDRIFITDSRYTLEAKQYCNKHTQVLESSDFVATAASVLKKAHIKSIIFNPCELSLALYQRLESKLENIKLVPKANFLQTLRIKKQEREIALIKASQSLNKKAFKQFGKFIRKHLDSKLSEKDLHYKAKAFLSHSGEYDLSFEPIVGINANGAKPHALPSATCKLLKHDILLFDAGIKFERYCSDMTRTASVSKDINFKKRQYFKNKDYQKIYDIVLKAQEYAIAKARAGMSGKDIDALARSVIDRAGYGKYFVHSTGHGVGLDIHELPRISRLSEDVIEDNMIFSIEPGIYLPGRFGVRIEDLVLMKNGRLEVL